MRVAGQEIHPWTKPAGHSMVNHELSLLGRILRHCRLWARIKPYYFPLDIPKWSPREILSEEDEEQFFKTAAADPESALAYWIATITNNTTASGCELRGLRLKHIFLRDASEISEIYIPEDAVKNDSRPRMIALNTAARWAVEQCYKRALQLGSCEPDHYVFPFRDRQKNAYVPDQPPSRWVFRRSWDKLRKATGFVELRPHDLRHHCITRLLENEVDPETVTAIAGHAAELEDAGVLRPSAEAREVRGRHGDRPQNETEAALRSNKERAGQRAAETCKPSQSRLLSECYTPQKVGER
jgi:integrase